MPRPLPKKPAHLEVTGLAPLPPAIEEWEHALVEPVLARLFDTPTATATGPKEARGGKAQ